MGGPAKKLWAYAASKRRRVGCGAGGTCREGVCYKDRCRSPSALLLALLVMALPLPAASASLQVLWGSNPAIYACSDMSARWHQLSRQTRSLLVTIETRLAQCSANPCLGGTCNGLRELVPALQQISEEIDRLSPILADHMITPAAGEAVRPALEACRPPLKALRRLQRSLDATAARIEKQVAASGEPMPLPLSWEQALKRLKAGTNEPLRPEPGALRLTLGPNAAQSGEPIPATVEGPAACLADPHLWVAAGVRSESGDFHLLEDAPPAPFARQFRIPLKSAELIHGASPKGGIQQQTIWLEAPLLGDKAVAYGLFWGRPNAVSGALESGLATPPLAISAPLRVSQPETCVGFSGIWDTNLGLLKLSERGGKVRGTYRKVLDGQGGLLTGRLRGDVLWGDWRSEFGGGGLRLALQEDGRSFKGTWSRFEEEFAGDGVWTGTCLLPAASQSGGIDGPMASPQAD